MKIALSYKHLHFLKFREILNNETKDKQYGWILSVWSGKIAQKWTVNSPHCSCREPEFSFSHIRQLTTTFNSSFKGSNVLASSGIHRHYVYPPKNILLKTILKNLDCQLHWICSYPRGKLLGKYYWGGFSKARLIHVLCRSYIQGSGNIKEKREEDCKSQKPRNSDTI